MKTLLAEYLLGTATQHGYAVMTESSRMLESSLNTAEDDDVTLNFRARITHHMALTVFTLLVMAFFVAATVEEFLKHYIVRGCYFPSPLKDPSAVMVYLVAGALGFAAVENVQYVFGATAPGFTFSDVEFKLIVFLTRLAMPVHLACALLQSVNLSKVCTALSHPPLSPLPSLILHTFSPVPFLRCSSSIRRCP